MDFSFWSGADPRLIIMTVGYLAGAVSNVALSFFVLLKAPTKPLNFLFCLMNLSVATFQVSHAIGVNIADPELSRFVFMFNLSNIFLSTFIAHWIAVLIRKTRELKWHIIVMYVAAALLFLFYVANPDYFLLPSVPKMYFPSYYEPGALHWIMRVIFNTLIPAYFIYQLYRVYRMTTDLVEKNRLKYVFVGLTHGYVIGSTAILLVFDIPFDPMWSMFFSIYPGFLAYSIVKYELMDIRIVAQRATLYASLTAFLVGFTALMNFGNDWFRQNYPAVPFLVVPALSSLLAVGLGFFIWSKVRESDILKYEFVNVITHKFRTPLTHIKWSVEELQKYGLSDQQNAIVHEIERSSGNLVELTNALAALERQVSPYNLRPPTIRLDALIKEIIREHQKLAKRKGINLVSNLPENVYVPLDRQRAVFIIEVLLDNAITYTSNGGRVEVSLSVGDDKVVIGVSDTGIGITKEEQPFIFNKFYRSKEAKLADTEGIGIGLYLSSMMAARSGGSIGFTSEGRGRGTTFTITLPRARHKAGPAPERASSLPATSNLV